LREIGVERALLELVGAELAGAWLRRCERLDRRELVAQGREGGLDLGERRRGRPGDGESDGHF
jgi:hypothetical protein